MEKFSEQLLVSIIIINYNGYNHLKECFDSLNNITYENKEIIFVDNNSNDKSIEFIKNNYADIKIIKLKKNYGFALPNNIASSIAKGEYYVLLNNDVVVDKNWLTELVNAAKISEDIGIVASKIYYYDNPEIINYAGGCFEIDGNFCHIGTDLKDNKFINTQRETFYGCGASLLITKELYKKIGLFDPLYFAYCEDLDLCWRAWLSGYKVIYAPKSFIYHKGGRIMENQVPKRLFLNERNLFRTILKNYQKKTLLKILPIYIKRRLLKLKDFILTFDKLILLYIQTYIKSFFWNLYHMRSLIFIRKKNYLLRKRSDKFILELMFNTFYEYVFELFKKMKIEQNK